MDKSSGALTFLPCILLWTADADDDGDTARLYLLHAGWGGSYAYLDSGRNSRRINNTFTIRELLRYEMNGTTQKDSAFAPSRPMP